MAAKVGLVVLFQKLYPVSFGYTQVQKAFDDVESSKPAFAVGHHPVAYFMPHGFRRFAGLLYILKQHNGVIAFKLGLGFVEGYLTGVGLNIVQSSQGAGGQFLNVWCYLHGSYIFCPATAS